MVSPITIYKTLRDNPNRAAAIGAISKNGVANVSSNANLNIPGPNTFNKAVNDVACSAVISPKNPWIPSPILNNTF